MASEILDFNYLVIVGLFLAGLGVLAFFARMLKPRIFDSRADSRHLVIMDQLSLGNSEKLCLVEVSGQPYLVGMARQQPLCIVPVISEIDSDDDTGKNMSRPSRSGPGKPHLSLNGTQDQPQKGKSLKSELAEPSMPLSTDLTSLPTLVLTDAQSVKKSGFFAKFSSAKSGPKKPLGRQFSDKKAKQAVNPPAKPASASESKEARSAVLSAMRSARRANPKLGF